MKKLFYLFCSAIILASCTSTKSVTKAQSVDTDFDKDFYSYVENKKNDTSNYLSKTFYSEYESSFDQNNAVDDNLNINITYPSYSYFMDPVNYWYTRPYYSYGYSYNYSYNPFYVGFSWGMPYYYGYGWPYRYYDYRWNYGWNYWNGGNGHNWYPHNGYYYGKRNSQMAPKNHNPRNVNPINVQNPRESNKNPRNVNPRESNQNPRDVQNTRNSRNVNNDDVYQRSTKQPKYNRNSQTYTSPTYRQPKTSGEYYNRGNVNPSNRNSTPTQRGNYSTPVTRGNSTPAQRGNYSAPAPRGNSAPAQRGNYSAPAPRGNSAPAQRGSYSAPTRSGGSYSAPTRSGGSYSAPSGSGGSSGGTRNSGGGGRR